VAATVFHRGDDNILTLDASFTSLPRYFYDWKWDQSGYRV